MIKLGSVKKEHLVGAAVGVGAVAIGYYLYKRNQNRVDGFLRKQGINIKTSAEASYDNMDLEELMSTKEHLEDLIAEKELSTNTAAPELISENEAKQ